MSQQQNLLAEINHSLATSKLIISQQPIPIPNCGLRTSPNPSVVHHGITVARDRIIAIVMLINTEESNSSRLIEVTASYGPHYFRMQWGEMTFAQFASTVHTNVRIGARLSILSRVCHVRTRNVMWHRWARPKWRRKHHTSQPSDGRLIVIERTLSAHLSCYRIALSSKPSSYAAALWGSMEDSSTRFEEITPICLHI